MKTARLFVIVVIAALPTQLPANPGVPDDKADHGVILTYHHVSDDTPPGTSVTELQFAAHLDYIADNGFHVWPLTELVRSLRSRTKVPDNVVALTFDDAYLSVFTHARPALRKLGWPYTVFVNTAAIDRNRGPYMSWHQLRQLVAEGVEIGNHSQNHEHMVRRQPDQVQSDEDPWREHIRSDIQSAQQTLLDELEVVPTLFAYPYGEYTPTLSAEIASMGLTGLGQHSGAVGFESDFSALPRFPIGGSYAGLEQLNTRLNAEPLMIKAVPAGPMILQVDQDHAELHLRIAKGPYDPARIACYASGQGRMQLSPAASDPSEVTIKPHQPLNPGRSKYNCTIPHERKSGIYFWWSYLLMKPYPDGAWYNN